MLMRPYPQNKENQSQYSVMSVLSVTEQTMNFLNFGSHGAPGPGQLGLDPRAIDVSMEGDGSQRGGMGFDVKIPPKP